VAIISTSFFTEIEDSIMSAVLADCGEGSALYSDPGYMFIQEVRRGQVMPVIDFAGAELPVFNIQYMYQDIDPVGAQTGADSFIHNWLAGVYAHWQNNDIVISPYNSEAFRKAVMASAGVLMKRVRRSIRLATLSANDDFGEVQAMLTIRRSAYNLIWLGEADCEVEIVFEITLTTEAELW